MARQINSMNRQTRPSRIVLGLPKILDQRLQDSPVWNRRRIAGQSCQHLGSVKRMCQGHWTDLELFGRIAAHISARNRAQRHGTSLAM
jgi:hypothetical protein